MIVPGSASLLLTSTDNGGYTIAKSLRFRASASAYIARTPSSTGDRQKWTWSGWVKRGNLGDLGKVLAAYNNSGNSIFALRFEANNTLNIYSFNTATEAYIWQVQTTQVFRDPSAWYHIVLAFDTTQATAANRIKLYINGSQVTSFSASSYPSQNTNTELNTNGYSMQIGTGTANNSTFTQNFDGYLAETYLIDGTQKSATDFGETDSTTGVWKPKRYTGTYGTNGFYLKFTDVATTSGSNAGLGKDFSGNGNYWNTNNISVTSGSTYDSMKDVPTLTDTDTANYCVANPLAKHPDVVVSDGNLKISLGSVTGGIRKTNASIALPTTGKYYWESKNIGTTNTNFFCGIQALTASLSVSATGDIFYNEAGEIQNNGSATTGFGAIAANDILGMAYDADANKIYFYKNNTIQNSGGTTPSFSGPYTPFFGMYLTNNAQEINFGQRPFAYTPPTGYKALNTYNLPDSTIVAGNKVMDATLYAGNGTSSNTITNAAGFKPDFVWAKNRTTGASHILVDSVRGVSNVLVSNSTGADQSLPSYITGLNSNGFSVGTSASDLNASSNNYVGWQWQAGQGTTSSNTNGSITSTVSVNASAGFSIVSWTGTGAVGTIGHGLGVIPSMIVVKNRSVSGNWSVWFKGFASNEYLLLNLTDSKQTNGGTSIWNGTHSSSIINIGSSSQTNGSGNSLVAYCWAEIPGFSKAFSYTGNGSSDGPFVHLGFRPKFVIIKRTDTTSNWYINDSSRDTYNVVGQDLAPNLSSAESNDTPVQDFLSNGFKLRNGSYPSFNASGGSYIGIAFAEVPFKNSLAR